MRWCIGVIHLVSKDRLIAQHQKTMCKSTGDKELALIVFAEFHHHVFAKGRTGFADIHSHIEHTPFDHPYELGLGKGPFLVVQTTKNAIRRLRLIVLYELYGTDVRIELLLFPRLFIEF